MMGATVIRRKVLEDRRLWLAEPREDAIPVFREISDAYGKLCVSEDLDFCTRARALGYSIWCHSGIRWGHLKDGFDLNHVVDMMYQAVGAYEIAKQMIDEPPRIEVANA